MSMFAQINAATTAASRIPALPDSVRKNERSGAARSRARTGRPPPAARGRAARLSHRRRPRDDLPLNAATDHTLSDSPPRAFQGMVGSPCRVQLIELRHVLLGERELEDLLILLDALAT